MFKPDNMKSSINPTNRDLITASTKRKKEDWCFRSGLAIDIKFGMPKYHCRFHGICKLDVDESDFQVPKILRFGMGKGWLFIPQVTHCLICFDKHSLTDATLSTYFIRSCFDLPEMVPFSEALNHRIGRQGSLQHGRYPIQEKGNKYSVLFRLKTA